MVQQRLAATVGDSFILLDKSIARAAIVDTVRRDLAGSPSAANASPSSPLAGRGHRP